MGCRKLLEYKQYKFTKVTEIGRFKTIIKGIKWEEYKWEIEFRYQMVRLRIRA